MGIEWIERGYDGENAQTGGTVWNAWVWQKIKKPQIIFTGPICCHSLQISTVLKATFPYSENLRIPLFSSYSRPGFWYVTLISISAQSGGNSWPTGESIECPSTAFYPLCRSKGAVDVEWIEGCFDKEVSSFVYRRRTGLSKVTFLKVG